MKELKLSEEDQLALVEALENETPISRDLLYRYMEAVDNHRKWEDSVLEIGIVWRLDEF